MKVIHFHCSKTAQKSYVDTEKEGKTCSRNFCLVCNEGGDGFGLPDFIFTHIFKYLYLSFHAYYHIYSHTRHL